MGESEWKTELRLEQVLVCFAKVLVAIVIVVVDGTDTIVVVVASDVAVVVIVEDLVNVPAVVGCTCRKRICSKVNQRVYLGVLLCEAM